VPDGRIVTLRLADAAALLYAIAIACRLLRGDAVARLAWTLGCAVFITHVAFAFQFYHHWSHAAAYAATAEETAKVTGHAWGWGLYLDYAFALLWIITAIWWRPYPARVGTAIQAFFAFMFFNATVVFGSGWIRWTGIAAAILLAALYGISRTRTSITLVPVGPVLINESKPSKK
jgi:hypothetical protein